MNSLVCLILYNHTTGVVEVPLFDQFKETIRLRACKEYGFPTDSFKFGDVYTYKNELEEDLDAVIQEIPGVVVRGTLCEEIVDSQNKMSV